MRRRLEQPRPLDEGLAHERKLEMLEIPQAPVDQLGGSRGSRTRVVALLGEHHLEATAGRVAGDGRAVDAAADDEQVEGLRQHKPPHDLEGL